MIPADPPPAHWTDRELSRPLPVHELVAWLSDHGFSVPLALAQIAAALAGTWDRCRALLVRAGVLPEYGPHGDGSAGIRLAVCCPRTGPPAGARAMESSVIPP